MIFTICFYVLYPLGILWIAGMFLWLHRAIWLLSRAGYLAIQPNHADESYNAFEKFRSARYVLNPLRWLRYWNWTPSRPFLR